MKLAVFALMFSSVFGQHYVEGTKEWKEVLDYHRSMAWKMSKKGYNMVVDLMPRRCNTSRDCPMQYRMGGCCGRSSVVRGAENLNDEFRKFYENIPTEGGWCTMGSTVDIFNQMGPEVNMFDYVRRLWESDPMVQATWGQIDPSRDFKSFDELNDFLKEKSPKDAVYPDKEVVFEGQCIDERLSPLDMLQTCGNSNDCMDPWGHFNGGCCGRSEVTKGQDLLHPELKKVFDIQVDGRGLCIPKMQADYVEGQKELNMMEYNQWNFENDWLTRAMWTMGMSHEEREDMTWDDMINRVRKEYPEMSKDIDNEYNIFFRGNCIDARLPGETVDWEEMMESMMDEDWDWSKWEEMQDMFDDIEVEMGDDFMIMTGDGMRIEMREGEDGAGSMHIILESATKIAASALTLGAAYTLF